MKKIFKIIFLILGLTPLFSIEGLLDITSESIDTLFLNEIDYNQSKFYIDDFEFSEGLEIYSNTEDVNIYFNGKKYDTDLLKLNDLDPGLYYISVKKSGYNSFNKWIEIEEGKRVIITLTLAREFGYLNVESNSDNFQLYLNNIKINNNIAIPTGNYILKVTSFGYSEIQKNINIIENYNTVEKFNLLEAPFLLESLTIQKHVFNPLANEGFKSNKLIIKVNGPGSGEIKISDSKGLVLFVEQLEFTTWFTTINYTGVDLKENYLNNGNYTISVTSENQEVKGGFIIDSNLFNTNLSISRGFSGLLFTPTAEINGEFIRQSTFAIVSSLKYPNYNLPFSFQSTILPNLSLHTGFDLCVSMIDQSYTDLFFGIFYVADFNLLLVGLNLNYLFEVMQTELIKNTLSHNLIINMPLTLKFNNLYMSITPEYKYTFSDKDTIGTGIGIHYDNQKTRVGISGRLDIKDTIEKYNYGFEYNFLLPDSQSYLGLSISGDDSLELKLMFKISVLF